MTETDPKDSSGTYDFVGIVMSKSAEGDAIADAMRQVEGVEVLENAAFWDIRAKDRLIIDFDEVSDFVGFEVDGSVIQREMSTTYGRQVLTDDQMMLFSDPLEAMEYLSG
jgi:propane monooxygenase coupling protein